MLKITKMLTLLVGASLVLASCSSSSDSTSSDLGTGYVIKGLFVKTDKDAKTCTIKGYEADAVTDVNDDTYASIGENGKMVFKTPAYPSGATYYKVTCKGYYIDEITGSPSTKEVTLTGFFSAASGIHNLNVLTTSSTQELKNRVATDFRGDKKGFASVNAAVSKEVAGAFYTTPDTTPVTDLSLLNSAVPQSAGDIALLAASINALTNPALINNDSTLADFSDSKTQYAAQLKGANLALLKSALAPTGIAPDSAGLNVGNPSEIKYPDIASTTLLTELTDKDGKAIEGNVTLNHGLIVLPLGTTESYISTKADAGKTLYFATLNGDTATKWVEVKEDTKLDFTKLTGTTTVILAQTKKYEDLRSVSAGNFLTQPQTDGMYKGYFRVAVSTEAVDAKTSIKFSAHTTLDGEALKPALANDPATVTITISNTLIDMEHIVLTIDPRDLTGLDDNTAYVLTTDKTGSDAKVADPDVKSTGTTIKGTEFKVPGTTTLTFCAFAENTGETDCSDDTKVIASAKIKVTINAAINLTIASSLDDVALTEPASAGDPATVSIANPTGDVDLEIASINLHHIGGDGDGDEIGAWILTTDAGTAVAPVAGDVDSTGATLTKDELKVDGVTNLVFCVVNVENKNATNCSDDTKVIAKAKIKVTTITAAAIAMTHGTLGTPSLTIDSPTAASITLKADPADATLTIDGVTTTPENATDVAYIMTTDQSGTATAITGTVTKTGADLKANDFRTGAGAVTTFEYCVVSKTATPAPTDWPSTDPLVLLAKATITVTNKN